MANPPFSYRWEPTEAMGHDVRFKNHGLAPKSAADFAFLLHGFHFLKDEGVIAIILPHDVLFINAAKHFAKGKRQNQLTDEHIAKVIHTYQFREEEARYSRRVEMAEIDLAATHGELVEIDKTIAAAKQKHNTFLKELGLLSLP